MAIHGRNSWLLGSNPNILPRHPTFFCALHATLSGPIFSRCTLALWELASVRLKVGETHPDYGRRKVWQEGLEVAMKIKGSQGRKRVEWVKVEHPFTALSPASDVHANHNEAHNSALRRLRSAYRRRQNLYAKRQEAKQACFGCERDWCIIGCDRIGDWEKIGLRPWQWDIVIVPFQ